VGTEGVRSHFVTAQSFHMHRCMCVARLQELWILT